MHRGDTNIAHQAQQRIVAAEQPIKHIGRGQHQQIVRTALPLIALQQRGRTSIIATL